MTINEALKIAASLVGKPYKDGWEWRVKGAESIDSKEEDYKARQTYEQALALAEHWKINLALELLGVKRNDFLTNADKGWRHEVRRHCRAALEPVVLAEEGDPDLTRPLTVGEMATKWRID
jgi:hypothetical protein